MLFDVCDSVGYIWFVIDYVVLIYYDSWDVGDVQVLCVGDVLVCGSDVVLQVGVVLVQLMFDGGCCLFGGGGQFCRKFCFNLVGFVQFDQLFVVYGFDWVVVVGDDQYVGCEGDGVEYGQGCWQCYDEIKGLLV